MVEPMPMKRAARAARPARPAVVLVPDLMGSDLCTSGTRIWLNYAALAERRHLRSSRISALRRWRRSRCSASTTSRSADYLSRTHEVIARSRTTGGDRSRTAATALADADRREARQEPGPAVRIVAHGMGGLVVAADGRGRPDLWNRVVRGTKALASCCSARRMAAPTSGRTAAGDPSRSRSNWRCSTPRLDARRIIEILQKLPGRPRAAAARSGTAFFDASSAGRRSPAAARRGQTPDPTLFECGRTRTALADTGTIDTPTASATSPGARLERSPASSCRTAGSCCKLTTEGDGRVTHQSARLKNLATWYADSAHGDWSPTREPSPPSSNCSQTGRATTAAHARRQARAGAASASGRRFPRQVLYPTERDLLCRRIRQEPRGAPSRGRRKPAGFRVSVVHGDLSFARFPIVVGHYEGDTIIGAGSRHRSPVRRRADDALQPRDCIRARSAHIAVVFREPTPLQQALQLPPGAIVVGLGRWGELTAGQIANHHPARRDRVRVAARQLRRRADERRERATGSRCRPERAADWRHRVEYVDRGFGGGHHARHRAGEPRADRRSSNACRRESPRSRSSSCTSTRAIEAARAAKRMARPLERRAEDPDRGGAAASARPARAGAVGGTRNLDAWRRWQITARNGVRYSRRELPEALRTWLGKPLRGGHGRSRAADVRSPADRGRRSGRRAADRLKFVSLSDRARAEVMLEQHQPELIERLIRSSVTDTSYKPEDARAHVRADGAERSQGRPRTTVERRVRARRRDGGVSMGVDDRRRRTAAVHAPRGWCASCRAPRSGRTSASRRPDRRTSSAIRGSRRRSHSGPWSRRRRSGARCGRS